MCMNLCKLSNRILDLGLTASELHVFAYLYSIHNSTTTTLLGDLVKVKQSIIVVKCCIAKTETVSKIISQLMQKGLVQRIVRTRKADGNLGTNSLYNQQAVHFGRLFLCPPHEL